MYKNNFTLKIALKVSPLLLVINRNGFGIGQGATLLRCVRKGVRIFQKNSLAESKPELLQQIVTNFNGFLQN